MIFSDARDTVISATATDLKARIDGQSSRSRINHHRHFAGANSIHAMRTTFVNFFDGNAVNTLFK